mgnify:CR=1 FL=1
MKVACPACTRESDLPEGARRCPFCGASVFSSPEACTEALPGTGPDPADVIPAGTSVGGFRIERLLGFGGMGVVYLAFDPVRERGAALKVLASRLVADALFVRRFEREASALSALSHPGIVALIGKGRDQGRFYVAMEFVEGVSLRDILGRRRLGPEEAAALLIPVCEALDYAHGQGVVHRDIKPENLLVSRDGKVKLADFGLARIVHGQQPATELTQTRTVMGTRDYMAPESRLSAKGADHRVDIYALGVILYELLTSELPVGRFLPPSQKRWMDTRWDGVALKALDPDPARRYQRAGDLARAMAAILPASGAPGRPAARTIHLACACGKRLYLEASRSGQGLVCSACGAALVVPEIFCPECKAELPEGVPQCLRCGTRVKGARR